MTERRIAHFNQPLPTKPTITEADDIIKQVSEQLGEDWAVTKLGRYWVFQQTIDGKRQEPRKSARRFDAAIADSLGCTISCFVKR